MIRTKGGKSMKLPQRFIAGVFSLFFLMLVIPAVGYADIIYVIDYAAGTGGNGALFRVDPVSGARTLLSDFGLGLPLGAGPNGVAVFRQQQPTSVPTMTEWGMIIFVVLAGLGAVYFIRRQKTTKS
jgi:hypothetical protein